MKVIFFVFFIYGCDFEENLNFDRILDGKSLNNAELMRIKNLGLLDSNEQIIQIFSNDNLSKAGNFYTNKRIASYWITDKINDNDTISILYKEIKSIDTIFDYYLFDLFYSHVKINDSTYHKIYVNADKDEARTFYKGVEDNWKKVTQ